MADLAGCGSLLLLAELKPRKFKQAGIIFHTSVYTKVCIILSKPVLRERWRERGNERRRNKKSAFFTHFLTQKFTPLSMFNQPIIQYALTPTY